MTKHRADGGLLSQRKKYIICHMNTITKIAAALLLASALLILASCQTLSAEESETERAYYEQKYANEPEPSEAVTALLDVLDTCVGGQYIIAGQGTPVSNEFINAMNKKYPDYFSDGRLEYLNDIADTAQDKGYSFPEDYAWDCSGLWWYAANEITLYEESTDRTANDTYYDYCTPIDKDDLRPGDIVFMMGADGHVSHMGIMGRHGYIYEAASGYVGVVCKRTIDKRIYKNIINDDLVVNLNWNAFGRPKVFE